MKATLGGRTAVVAWVGAEGDELPGCGAEHTARDEVHVPVEDHECAVGDGRGATDHGEAHVSVPKGRAAVVGCTVDFFKATRLVKARSRRL